jgi:site-specific DNA-methyltransferase (adenine-specific)
MELTLHNGDCLEIMKSIPDKTVDLIICDLPYGCLTNQTGESKGFERPSWKKNKDLIRANRSASACAWDIKIDLDAFWKQIKRIRKSDHSPCIHFCTTKFGYELIKSNPDEFRYDLVWNKQRGISFLTANKMPMRSHEMIYVFSKVGAFYERKDFTGDFEKWIRTRPNDKSRKSTQYGALRNDSDGGEGKRCVLSVIQYPTSSKKGGHPTEKPSELYRFLIERYCPVGGTVLDPTFGSGNSVFTAFAMGRSAIGIEKDEAFFKKAEEKLNALE